jgi:hypothetical protein
MISLVVPALSIPAVVVGTLAGLALLSGLLARGRSGTSGPPLRPWRGERPEDHAVLFATWGAAMPLSVAVLMYLNAELRLDYLGVGVAGLGVLVGVAWGAREATIVARSPTLWKRAHHVFLAGALAAVVAFLLVIRLPRPEAVWLFLSGFGLARWALLAKRLGSRPEARDSRP